MGDTLEYTTNYIHLGFHQREMEDAIKSTTITATQDTFWGKTGKKTVQRQTVKLTNFSTQKSGYDRLQ